MELCFALRELKIIGYSYADFVGDRNDRISTSGHLFLFGGEQSQGQAKQYVYLDV